MNKLKQKLTNKFPILLEKSIFADIVSFLILAVLLAFIGLLWNGALYLFDIPEKEITQLSFFRIVAKLLKTGFSASLGQIALAIISLFLIYRGIGYFRQKRRLSSHPIWREQIGNYTVGELFTILKKETLQPQTRGMEMTDFEPKTDSLLVLLEQFEIFFNAGISQETETGAQGYLWGIIAPQLVGYGLLTKETVTDNLRGYAATTTTYQTSDLGHKFISCMRRLEVSMKHKE